MEKLESLDRIKEIELSILKEVQQFCIENELRYVLMFGTLIGAIRHNGFIPWDDDIDICMPREDYDFFEKSFPVWGRKKHLYIAGPHSEECFLPRHMLKVCDDRTILNENTHEKNKTMGLFIDIFPLDNIPKNTFFAKLWTICVRTYKYRILASTISTKSEAFQHFSFAKKTITRILKKGNTQSLTEKFVKASARFSKKATGRVTVYYSYAPTYFELKDFFPSVLHSFEKDKFQIPNGYDKILRSVYGDYTVLPPVEKRISQHTADVYVQPDYLSER